MSNNIIQISYHNNDVVNKTTAELIDRCMYTCRSVPDSNYILYTDDEVDKFVANKYPRFISTFSKYDNIMRNEAARILLLLYYGGLYLDCDIMLNPDFNGIEHIPISMDTIFEEYPVMSLPRCTESIRSFCNSAMYFSRGSPFLKYIYNKLSTGMVDDTTPGDNSKILYVTGPGMITRESYRYLQTYPTRLNIMSNKYFEYDDVQTRHSMIRNNNITFNTDSIGVHFSIGSWLRCEKSVRGTNGVGSFVG